MNEQDYQSRHSALDILIKSTWRRVDAEQDRDMRAVLMQRADKLQDELIALEKLYRSRHDPLMIVESIEVTPSDPWIDYHDQLIKEWFDGERALIDDLYPDAPTKNPPAWAGFVCATMLAIPATAIIVMLVWLAKMLFGF